jgi:hypothetical protein
LANIDQFVEEIPISNPSQIDLRDAAAPNLKEAVKWFFGHNGPPLNVTTETVDCFEKRDLRPFIVTSGILDPFKKHDPGPSNVIIIFNPFLSLFICLIVLMQFSLVA